MAPRSRGNGVFTGGYKTKVLWGELITARDRGAVLSRIEQDATFCLEKINGGLNRSMAFHECSSPFSMRMGPARNANESNLAIGLVARSDPLGWTLIGLVA